MSDALGFIGPSGANYGLHPLWDCPSHGVRLPEIEQCGHFPMYSNLARMWAEMGHFIARVEGGYPKHHA